MSRTFGGGRGGRGAGGVHGWSSATVIIKGNLFPYTPYLVFNDMNRPRAVIMERKGGHLHLPDIEVALLPRIKQLVSAVTIESPERGGPDGTHYTLHSPESMLRYDTRHQIPRTGIHTAHTRRGEPADGICSGVG